ncbi:MAG: hypothetical protein DSM106950_10805 [Stigonema ocellatum SAG 48.90 = DSM 106950]|nr:hypothetical protein [Stigonema ocellatum SAG 48.90 = DSM 106950]
MPKSYKHTSHTRFLCTDNDISQMPERLHNQFLDGLPAEVNGSAANGWEYIEVKKDD